MLLKSLGAIIALLPFVTAQSGSGVTTRYWDCCKPSCSWTGKAAVSSPVRTCDSMQNTLGPDVKSGCDGGSAFTCADNQPWAVSDSLAYGFAAVKLSGSSESQWCCQCYQLTFTSGPASGKTMIVQATNTGGDLGSNHFDLLMPGGGVGIFNGCNAQYGSWNGGAQYGGVSSKDQCANLPSIVQPGCGWRFDWFQGSDNPTVEWKAVQCPAALTKISGCTRVSEAGGLPDGTGGSATTSTSTTTTSKTSSTTTTTTSTTTSSSSSRTSSIPTSLSSSISSSSSSSTVRYAVTLRSSSSSRSTSIPNSSSTSSAASARQSLWGQCGGINWSGPTACVAAAKCIVQNRESLGFLWLITLSTQFLFSLV
ncbi:hypothetical protein FRC16_010411 [Serendipita sp. 398]|nr:hypothetical protein FRC16_010411 [Serendipita sp. 398]